MEQPLGYVVGRMMSADLERQSMNSNRVQGHGLHGLRSSDRLSLILALLTVLFTPFSLCSLY